MRQVQIYAILSKNFQNHFIVDIPLCAATTFYDLDAMHI